jgi:hypothetical protein
MISYFSNKKMTKKDAQNAVATERKRTEKSTTNRATNVLNATIVLLVKQDKTQTSQNYL